MPVLWPHNCIFTWPIDSIWYENRCHSPERYSSGTASCQKVIAIPHARWACRVKVSVTCHRTRTYLHDHRETTWATDSRTVAVLQWCILTFTIMPAGKKNFDLALYRYTPAEFGRSAKGNIDPPVCRVKTGASSPTGHKSNPIPETKKNYSECKRGLHLLSLAD
jgi:hypothetical protein